MVILRHDKIEIAFQPLRLSKDSFKVPAEDQAETIPRMTVIDSDWVVMVDSVYENSEP